MARLPKLPKIPKGLRRRAARKERLAKRMKEIAARKAYINQLKRKVG